MIDMPDMVLVMTAHARPRYLEQVLASWQWARGVGRLGGLVVALGPSAVEEEQAQTIELGAGALGLDRKLTILTDSPEAQASPGMHRALGEAVVWARAHFPQAKSVICGEEDIIVSSDVLEYMSWALTRFEDDPLVAAVCAHDIGGSGWDIPGIGQQGTYADQATAALSDYFSPWVWATWTGPKLDWILADWDWDANKGDHPNRNGYDWSILRRIHQAGLVSVVPSASRSQNIGRDGGYYARPELFDQTQSASFRRRRDPQVYHLIGDSNERPW